MRLVSRDRYHDSVDTRGHRDRKLKRTTEEKFAALVVNFESIRDSVTVDDQITVLDDEVALNPPELAGDAQSLANSPEAEGVE